jgi:hypothetical protein
MENMNTRWRTPTKHLVTQNKRARQYNEVLITLHKQLTFTAHFKYVNIGQCKEV